MARSCTYAATHVALNRLAEVYILPISVHVRWLLLVAQMLRVVMIGCASRLRPTWLPERYRFLV